MMNSLFRTLHPIFLAALALLLPTLAAAHSFNALMIVPAGADMLTVRADMESAFLIASLERDDHDNNHADGHLGGLDVYLSMVAIGEAPSGDAPDIIAAPLLGAGGDMPDMLPDVPFLGVTDAALVQTYLDQAADPQLAPFVNRFTAQTGYAPGPEAIAAYAAARRIDQAVRQLGELDDTDRLQALLAVGNQ